MSITKYVKLGGALVIATTNNDGIISIEYSDPRERSDMFGIYEAG